MILARKMSRQDWDEMYQNQREDVTYQNQLEGTDQNHWEAKDQNHCEANLEVRTLVMVE